MRFDCFNVRNIPSRLEHLKVDPWAGFFDVRQSVTIAILKRMDVEP